jgi:purine-nucleoside phosphorylase
VAIPYAKIPNFPATTVSGHAGRLIAGRMGGKHDVLVFEGRPHYYEGVDMHQVAYPAYVAHILGATILIVTNAAGGINASYEPGDLMLIRDHLNFMGDNPLRGGQRLANVAQFVRLRDAYDGDLLWRATQTARSATVKLHMGVYAALPGPAYETAAELRMLYKLGADAVGMSTVPEVIAARHAGLRVLGISVIANDAYPFRRSHPAELAHDGVVSVVEQSAHRVGAIIEGVIESLGH